MERVKINLPETLLHKLRLRVRITDINYGNHTGNDRIVAMIHDVRAEWLRTNGYTELDINGTGLIMADLAMQFTGESFFGDELEVQLYVDKNSISKVAFNLYYLVTKVTSEGTFEISKAKTGMVSFNYQILKPAPFPPSLTQMLNLLPPR